MSCCLRFSALRRSSAAIFARSVRARLASRLAWVAAFSSAVLCEVFFCAIEASFVVVSWSVVGSWSGVGEKRTVSRASRDRGRTTSQRLRASRPMSRAISPGYFSAASGITPPPPKQPQSIDSPRAQAEEMPMMKATKSSAETTAALRVSTSEDQAQPDDDLDDREQVTDRRHDRLRQQVVGPHGTHALGRVGQLQATGHDPHAARDQARDEADPVLHDPDPRRRD